MPFLSLRPLLPRPHRGMHDREGPGAKAAWEPRATHACVTWGLLLCAPPGPTHSIDLPSCSSDQASSWLAGQGQGVGAAKAKTARSKVRFQGPGSQVSPGTQRAWSEHLPAPSVLVADQGFHLGGIPGGLRGGQGDPGSSFLASTVACSSKSEDAGRTQASRRLPRRPAPQLPLATAAGVRGASTFPGSATRKLGGPLAWLVHPEDLTPSLGLHVFPPRSELMPLQF